MNKKVIGLIVGAIVLIAGFFYFTQPAEVEGTPSNHTYGKDSSEVVLVEYGDFQCSGCATYYPILKQVKENYKDQFTFQYRHLPLEEIHVNGRAAARAAEAAAKQDKFWEMHDKLFETQGLWSTTGDPLSVFEGYARELGLNTEQFTNDYKSSEVNATINADIALFRDTGEPKSTPTFFLNGKKVEPVASIDSFKELLDQAIADAGGETSADPAGATRPAEGEEAAQPASDDESAPSE